MGNVEKSHNANTFHFLSNLTVAIFALTNSPFRVALYFRQKHQILELSKYMVTSKPAFNRSCRSQLPNSYSVTFRQKLLSTVSYLFLLAGHRRDLFHAFSLTTSIWSRPKKNETEGHIYHGPRVFTGPLYCTAPIGKTWTLHSDLEDVFLENAYERFIFH